VAVAGLLAACRTLEPPAVPLPLDDPRPGVLLSALDERAASVAALRGLARLAVDGPGGSLRSRQVVVAARPASLRVEVLGFLSQTQVLLVTDGETYELFDARARRFESEPVRPGLLWEVAGVDLEPEEAVRVLLGAPALDGLRLATAASVADARVRLLMADPEGRPRHALEFDPEGELRRLAAFGAEGEVLWDARYDDVRGVGASRLAHAIELTFPRTRVEARIELSQVELNPPLAPAVFRLDRPPGGAGPETGG
jgi:hypothetical protein